MIPSYKLMQLIVKECIQYLKHVEGADVSDNEDIYSFTDIYSNVVTEICDGALDMDLYHVEAKKYGQGFNKHMLDTLLSLYEKNKKNYKYTVDDVTYTSDEYYVLEKVLKGKE